MRVVLISVLAVAGCSGPRKAPTAEREPLMPAELSVADAAPLDPRCAELQQLGVPTAEPDCPYEVRVRRVTPVICAESVPDATEACMTALPTTECVRGDQRHGPYRSVRADGTLAWAGQYEDGEKAGLWTRWSSSGQLLMIVDHRGRQFINCQ